MKRLIPGIALALLLTGLCCHAVLAQDFPKPQGHVNDFADLLNPVYKRQSGSSTR